MIEQEIQESFPQIERIEDDDLRQRIIDVWSRAIQDNNHIDLESIPWWPPLEKEFTGSSMTTVEHVRAVTDLTIAIVDAIEDTIEITIDRDIAIAGALLHDCSKLYELEETETGELHEWIPHPHYGVHVLAAAGCSEHLQHIALSHSQSSAVDPRTIESMVVQAADQLAVDALFWKQTGHLQ